MILYAENPRNLPKKQTQTIRTNKFNNKTTTQFLMSKGFKSTFHQKKKNTKIQMASKHMKIFLTS